eukprot:5019675-Pyramimonas_sp.AAC.2
MGARRSEWVANVRDEEEEDHDSGVCEREATTTTTTTPTTTIQAQWHSRHVRPASLLGPMGCILEQHVDIDGSMWLLFGAHLVPFQINLGRSGKRIGCYLGPCGSTRRAAFIHPPSALVLGTGLLGHYWEPTGVLGAALAPS